MFPVKKAQDLGIKTIAYLDDFIVWADSEEECKLHVTQLRSILENLGLVINEQKSQMIPSQTIEWLGIEWDSRLVFISYLQISLLAVALI